MNFFLKKSLLFADRRRQFHIFGILLFFLLNTSGCIFVAATTVGAVGGYVISKDTIQGDYDAAYNNAWSSAMEVTRTLGTVKTSDSAKGVIEALIDRASVRIEITQLTPKAVRIKIKARKGVFPRLGTAENVFVKVTQKLM